MRNRSDNSSFHPEPFEWLPKRLKVAWAKDRANNIAEVQQYIEEFLLQKHPEHKIFLVEVTEDNIGLLLWKAFEVLLDSDKTLDCTLEALIKACRSLEKRTIEEVREMHLLSWLCESVHRRALTVRQKETRHVSLEATISAVGTDSIVWYPASKARVSEQPEQVAVYRDDCELLVNLLENLPRYQLYAIMMHYLAGERWAVVAPRFWNSAKAANMAASRGLHTLRAMMEEEHLHLRIGDFQSESFRGMLEEALLKLEGGVRTLI